MRRWMLLGALGVACYLSFLVATIPAHFLWERFAPAEVAAGGIAGTPWRGSAARLSVETLRLDDVQWRFAPSSLLRGSAGWHLRSALEEGSLDATVRVHPQGTLFVSNGELAWSLQQLLAVAGYQGLRGALDARLHRLALEGSWPAQLEGELRVTDLRINELGAHSFGNFLVRIEMQEELIIGDVRDQGGPLEIVARIEVNPAPGYVLQGRLRPREDAPAELTGMLPLLGSPDAQGWRSFSLEARL